MTDERMKESVDQVSHANGTQVDTPFARAAQPDVSNADAPDAQSFLRDEPSTDESIARILEAYGVQADSMGSLRRDDAGTQINAAVEALKRASYWHQSGYRLTDDTGQPATFSLDPSPFSPGSPDALNDPTNSRRMHAMRMVKQKDHISAGLLAVFMGLFGLHKFYLGYNEAAFTMLAVSIIGGIMTLGLAAAVVWVIAIIEGIVYLTKTQSEFDRLYVTSRREWF